VTASRLDRATLATTLVLVLLTGACTPAPAAGGEPLVDHIPVLTSPRELVLPFDAYFYTNEMYVAMLRAAVRLTSDCMARFGASYPSDVPDSGRVPGITFPDFSRWNETRYGVFDLESAMTRGYNRREPDDPYNQRDPDPLVSRRDGLHLSEQELFLLNGRASRDFADVSQLPIDPDGRPLPDDGCWGEANRLISDGHTFVPVHNMFANETLRLSKADSRVVAAVAAWSECMKARGYAYADVSDPRKRQWPEPPGEEEIATATADVECKIQTNLVGTRYAVESAYQRRIIDENAELFARQRAFLDAVTRNAARVLAGDG
jgi:hypothetical protein